MLCATTIVLLSLPFPTLQTYGAHPDALSRSIVIQNRRDSEGVKSREPLKLVLT